MTQISLKTTTMQGDIYIGGEVFSSRLPALLQGQKNFAVTDSNVYGLYKDFFNKHFKREEVFILPAGEENKTFQSLYQILSAMAQTGLLRNSRLFVIGGGVVGDIGGLAGALYMRGISCVQIPTTLLAQVDSSVGGKTAVDLGGIKNIVGAFYQPREVLICPNFLQSLPEREIKCGLGEIVKYAVLNGEIFDCLAQNLDKLHHLEFLKTLIYPCVSHKAKVVQVDEKESGERRSLNVGHTTGHAIELNYNLSHGEGVLYGIYLEAKTAIAQGVCEKEYGEKLLEIVKTAIQTAPYKKLDFLDIDNCLEKAKSDKKNTQTDMISMAVAKRKNEWTMLSLPFEEYRTALKNAVKDL